MAIVAIVPITIDWGSHDRYCVAVWEACQKAVQQQHCSPCSARLAPLYISMHARERQAGRHLPRLRLCQLAENAPLQCRHVDKALDSSIHHTCIQASAAVNHAAIKLVDHEALKGKV